MRGHGCVSGRRDRKLLRSSSLPRHRRRNARALKPESDFAIRLDVKLSIQLLPNAGATRSPTLAE